MTSRPTLLAAVLSVCLAAPAAAQTTASRAALRVVSAGPSGELLPEQDNEVRVVFSEPMVALGRVPPRVRPAFFTIAPAVPGSYRWSGTTILIFTPAKPFPKATKYDVTIAAGAAAVSGRTLAQPYTFSFQTATAKLLQTNSYRPGGRVDAAPIVVLHFSQPVKPEDVAPHLKLTFQDHSSEFSPPVVPAAVVTRLRTVDPDAATAFAEKVRRARVAASATGPVAFELAKDWDKKRFPPAPDMVVITVTTPVVPENWIQVATDGRVPSLAGLAVSNRPDSYSVSLERAFFATSFGCESQCDPDNSNPITFTVPVKAKAFSDAVRAVDVTDARRERPIGKGKPRARESWEQDDADTLTLADAGLDHPPASTWFASLPPTLTAADGQTLGYTWGGLVENWHQTAFTSFGDGHGVWEKGGGGVLPFYARNFQNVKQWATAIEPSQLMPTLVRLQPNFEIVPETAPLTRRLGGAVDKTNSHGLDLSAVLKPNGTGLVWAAVEEADPIARAKAYHKRDNLPITHSSLIQVTNLGVSVKDSPQNTLIFVTRLDNAAPVAGASVSIVRPDGRPSWSGTTGPDGVAMAPQSRLRDPRNWETFSFIVTAEKDGDVAYVGSDWNEGVMPWDYGMEFDLDEAQPLLRGTVFTDRGVYKLGEEVHVKAVVRSNTPQGIRLLPDGTPIAVTVTDARNKVVDERVVKANAWSTAEWTFAVPAEGSLGNYAIKAVLESQKPPAKAKPAGAEDDEDEMDWRERKKMVFGSFLVAAYRRPDFRVDVTLTGAAAAGAAKAGDTAIAGDPLKGVVNARYLFGAPMNKRPTHWTFTRAAAYGAPASITDKFPEERWTFVGWSDTTRPAKTEMGAADAQLAANGQLALTLKTEAQAGLPYTYTLEGDVEDVSRQHIANRKSFLVHPAPWYIGVRNLALFATQKDGLKTELVAVGLDGIAVPDVAIDVKLTQIQWQSVRRAEGNGFYTWETERKAVPAGEWHVKSGGQPVPFTAPVPAGGYYILEARADADLGRYTTTRASFYALGDGYTAWQRYDHNRIDLVADKTSYKPGDTARILIQSPWEQATALVTTEREGVRTHRQFTLTSTQQSIDVPLSEEDIPNVYVSVLLVKGRSKPIDPVVTEASAGGDRREAAARASEDDPSDPGKPAFRMGYVQLGVEDATKRLTVAVAANKEEYRPATNATVTVDVKDLQGRGAASEVTLWAVDYGVLSLTAYHTPDVLDSVYVHKALEVLTEDTRQKIISRRVITPKGATDGGGGGDASGVNSVRQDFRVLAFWLGSVVTDGRGHASLDVKLPESLTTYRIMAVAGDKGSRFGSSDSEIRINKPVTLKATFPRFLAVGDKASFGAVVTSQLKTAGPATVTIESLDPAIMQFADATPQTVNVDAGGSVEVRFDAAGRSTGRARVRMTVKLADETDAFQDVIPVEVLASPETVSAVGQADDASPTAAEKLTLPTDVVTTFGGLHVDLASTALVGLGEGARYLVEYPYGCAEQKGSRALALLLAADLGDAFALPGIDAAQLRPTVQSTLKELERFQCESGGFAYWPGDCRSQSPYLTAYLLHVFKVAADLKYAVDKPMVARAYTYLETSLAQKPPVNESWWPSYTAWQAFAVKVLVEGGRNQDSNLTRLYGYRDKMPVFALAYLTDALMAKGEGGGVRVAELRRRMANAILPEAATAHVEELNDPYLLWYWNSNVRSTAIVLRTMVDAPNDASLRPIVAWLMQARRNGRWGNTQENAIAMESLVAYYRKFESAAPNFTAVARLGGTQLASVPFQGRSTEAKSTDLPMARLLTAGPAGAEQPLTFTRDGAGTLFYSARMRYAVDRLFQTGMDQGLRVERSYAPYVETGTRPAATSFKAGDLIKVTLTLNLTKERRFVAVTDPLPAGFEPVESWFATSAANLAHDQDEQETSSDWFSWWQHGGFDHVERHDDRVELFATRLGTGRHTFAYVVRATTAGTFRTAPAHAEEMYEPEVFGRTATAVIDVRKQ